MKSITGKGSQLDLALSQLVQEVRNGLKHGFFEYTITGEIVSGGNRRLLLKTGISQKFIIPENELQAE